MDFFPFVWMKQDNIRRTLISLTILSRKPFRPNLLKFSAPFKTFHIYLHLFLPVPWSQNLPCSKGIAVVIATGLPDLSEVHSFKSPSHWALTLEIFLHSWNNAKALAHSTLTTLFQRPFLSSFLVSWEHNTHDRESDCNPPGLQFAHSTLLVYIVFSHLGHLFKGIFSSLGFSCFCRTLTTLLFTSMKSMLHMSSSATAQQLPRHPAMPKVQFLNPIFSTLRLAVTVSIWD